jgi:hypothetical protein
MGGGGMRQGGYGAPGGGRDYGRDSRPSGGGPDRRFGGGAGGHGAAPYRRVSFFERVLVFSFSCDRNLAHKLTSKSS